MILYEVNIQIDEDVYNDYITWLELHIQKILRLPGFNKALLLNDMQNKSNVTVQYYLNSAEALDNYLLNNAEQMRADGLLKFSNKFTVTRRFLKISEVFQKIDASE